MSQSPNASDDAFELSIVVAGDGAALAERTHPWLLLLDAGDEVHPDLAARVRDALATDPALDAVLCGWALVDDDGYTLLEQHCDDGEALFDLLARRLAFPSCACVVRRSVLESAGALDAALRDGADWLLWQRIARRGARFGRIVATLALHRIHVRSAADVERALDRALETIALGHSTDPEARLSAEARYFAGRLASPDAAVLDAVFDAAGALLALDADVTRAIERLPVGHPVSNVTALADRLARAAPLALARPVASWGELWDPRRPAFERFLDALEVRAQQPGLARELSAEVQRRVLPYLSSRPTPVTATAIATIEVTSAFVDLVVGADAERAQLVVSLEGTTLGVVELPAVDGRVHAAAIRAAVAERYAWPILGRFFERTLGADPARHDAEGWGTLLSQLWAPDPPALAVVVRVVDRVGAWLRRADDGRSHGMPRRMVVEVGGRVPWFVVGRRNVDAELRVAGVRVASTEIVVGRPGVVTGSAVRAALMEAAGIALCRVIVRDVLLGQPFDGGATIGARLERLRRAISRN